MVPIRISAWPPIYLVALLDEKSAPKSIGDYKTGEQNVLSTQEIRLCSFAKVQIFLISQIFKVGLVGVSIQIALVFFKICLCILSKSHISIKLTYIPKFLIAIYLKNL